MERSPRRPPGTQTISASSRVLYRAIQIRVNHKEQRQVQVGDRPGACTDTPTDEAPKVADDGRDKTTPTSLLINELEYFGGLPFWSSLSLTPTSFPITCP